MPLGEVQDGGEDVIRLTRIAAVVAFVVLLGVLVVGALIGVYALVQGVL